MNLIKINLLPYRELQDQKQKQQLNTILALGALVGAAIVGLVYMALLGAVANQNSRNESLREGIRALDATLEEIKELNQRKQSFLERKRKVEELDSKRFEGAKIIDTLNRLVPEGVYLSELNSVGGDKVEISPLYEITGHAISDNKVAAMMASLPSTAVFAEPVELIRIEKTDDGQKFILRARLFEPVSSDGANSDSTMEGN